MSELNKHPLPTAYVQLSRPYSKIGIYELALRHSDEEHLLDVSPNSARLQSLSRAINLETADARLLWALAHARDESTTLNVIVEYQSKITTILQRLATKPGLHYMADAHRRIVSQPSE